MEGHLGLCLLSGVPLYNYCDIVPTMSPILISLKYMTLYPHVLIRVLCACMALICYNTIETMYTIVITMQCKYSTTNARGIVSYKVVGSLQENKKYINFIEIYSHFTSSYRKTQVKTSGLLCKNNVHSLYWDTGGRRHRPLT